MKKKKKRIFTLNDNDRNSLIVPEKGVQAVIIAVHQSLGDHATAAELERLLGYQLAWNAVAIIISPYGARDPKPTGDLAAVHQYVRRIPGSVFAHIGGRPPKVDHIGQVVNIKDDSGDQESPMGPLISKIHADYGMTGQTTLVLVDEQYLSLPIHVSDELAVMHLRHIDKIRTAWR